MCMRVVLCQMKNGLPALTGAVDVIQRCGQEFVVGGLHALLSQRTGVFAGLLAPCAKPRIGRRGDYQSPSLCT